MACSRVVITSLLFFSLCSLTSFKSAAEPSLAGLPQVLPSCVHDVHRIMEGVETDAFTIPVGSTDTKPTLSNPQLKDLAVDAVKRATTLLATKTLGQRKNEVQIAGSVRYTIQNPGTEFEYKYFVGIWLTANSDGMSPGDDLSVDFYFSGEQTSSKLSLLAVEDRGDGMDGGNFYWICEAPE